MSPGPYAPVFRIATENVSGGVNAVCIERRRVCGPAPPSVSFADISPAWGEIGLGVCRTLPPLSATADISPLTGSEANRKVGGHR